MVEKTFKQKAGSAYFISKVFILGFVVGMLTAPYGLYKRSDSFAVVAYEDAFRISGSALPVVSTYDDSDLVESDTKLTKK